MKKLIVKSKVSFSYYDEETMQEKREDYDLYDIKEDTNKLFLRLVRSTTIFPSMMINFPNGIDVFIRVMDKYVFYYEEKYEGDIKAEMIYSKGNLKSYLLNARSYNMTP